jgi:tight adherence protein B
MAVTLFTFAIVLALVLGGYWLFVLRLEGQEHASLRRRLRGGSIREKTKLAILKDVEKGSSVDFLDRLLQRNESLISTLRRLLEQADSRVTPGTFVLLVIAFAVAGFLIANFYTPWPALSVVAGLLAGTSPYLYFSRKRASRLALIEEQFPDAVDLIARSLRAGHAFTTGIGMVSDEVPAPVGS